MKNCLQMPMLPTLFFHLKIRTVPTSFIACCFSGDIFSLIGLSLISLIELIRFLSLVDSSLICRKVHSNKLMNFSVFYSSGYVYRSEETSMDSFICDNVNINHIIAHNHYLFLEICNYQGHLYLILKCFNVVRFIHPIINNFSAMLFLIHISLFLSNTSKYLKKNSVRPP